MVHQWLFFLLFFMLSVQSGAQDERYYRKILSGELPSVTESLKESSLPTFNVSGPLYRVDINEDKIEETIIAQKRDGVDWIEIRNASGTKIFESKLLAMGVSSHLYKIKIVDLSPRVKALILFMDEGFIKGKKFESTARLFVMTIEDNDFSKIWITSGPHFFHEKESHREQYWRRNYTVNVYDSNGDGIKEISVMYNHIQRYMIYNGKGEWKRF